MGAPGDAAERSGTSSAYGLEYFSKKLKTNELVLTLDYSPFLQVFEAIRLRTIVFSHASTFKRGRKRSEMFRMFSMMAQ